MCVTAQARIMGCGKSRHHSPEASENDLKPQGSLKKDSKQNYSKNPRKKKYANEGTNINTNVASSEALQSTKKESNGKNKPRDGCKSTVVSSSFSSRSRSTAASTSVQLDVDKSNGSTKPQGSYYVLEVPNEIYNAETSLRATTAKEVKIGTKPSKSVHATTSQLEFFKMLDEKIEMGSDYQMSNEAAEISVNETNKQ